MTQTSLEKVIADTVVWDNHGCMPLRPGDETFLPQLERYRTSGFDVVTLNVGFDALPWENSLRMLAQFRSWIGRHSDKFHLVGSASDIREAKKNGRLGICFDLEGGNALNGDLSMVEMFYHLGVRWMLIAYNKNNLLGGGCQDDDPGLTDFGREVIIEMNRVGMVVCCSHTGQRSAMEALEQSDSPVIFSHSNPAAIWPHPRNISDQMIRACAETGGVIGINGVGPFLGNNDIRSETFVRHIDHIVQLVGPRHVGLAFDYVFDHQELTDYIEQHPDLFPPEDGYAGGMNIVRPEQLMDIMAGLQKLGYSDSDLRNIAGENHLRIAQTVWKDT
ncbi:MAG: membrane dipeptidase [Alphaproteobacteria bacterium]|nr:MAG: membrane dipeptidase [Alphaproteobacteria bacterium]